MPSGQPSISSSFGSDLRVCLRRDGGAKEDRTPDLLLARQALSQLSYGPIFPGGNSIKTEQR